jgi:ATP-dependent DNA ligase
MGFVSPSISTATVQRSSRNACKLGLEGIVSKRRDLPYRSGRCRAWVKVKNPQSPAVLRIEDGTW